MTLISSRSIGRGWGSLSNKNKRRRPAELLLGLFQRKLRVRKKPPLLLSELCNFIISDLGKGGRSDGQKEP